MHSIFWNRLISLLILMVLVAQCQISQADYYSDIELKKWENLEAQHGPLASNIGWISPLDCTAVTAVNMGLFIQKEKRGIVSQSYDLHRAYNLQYHLGVNPISYFVSDLFSLCFVAVPGSFLVADSGEMISDG